MIRPPHSNSTIPYSGQEIRDRLLEVGFSDVQLFGGLDGSEYGLNARHWLLLLGNNNEPLEGKLYPNPNIRSGDPFLLARYP